MRFRPEVAASLASSSALFLFLGKEELGRSLESGVAGLARHVGPGRRTEVRSMPILGTSGFRIPLSVQPVVMAMLVDWLDQTLPRQVDAPRAAIATA